MVEQNGNTNTLANEVRDRRKAWNDFWMGLPDDEAEIFTDAELAQLREDDLRNIGAVVDEFVWNFEQFGAGIGTTDKREVRVIDVEGDTVAEQLIDAYRKIKIAAIEGTDRSSVALRFKYDVFEEATDGVQDLYEAFAREFGITGPVKYMKESVFGRDYFSSEELAIREGVDLMGPSERIDAYNDWREFHGMEREDLDYNESHGVMNPDDKGDREEMAEFLAEVFPEVTRFAGISEAGLRTSRFGKDQSDLTPFGEYTKTHKETMGSLNGVDQTRKDLDTSVEDLASNAVHHTGVNYVD